MQQHFFVRLAASVVAAMAIIVAPAAEEPEEGFTPLFDGESLEGWWGDTEGYVPQDGVLLCSPGGNLLTEKEYSNFVLRFEFKLTPGANNGLGIRVPKEGHPSYDGMELQILDDTAEKYAELHPWQYHGSIYGIVPAERGHLRPVGEWNEQEVIANGAHIKVILNGVTIVDANLDEVEPLDGREHAGQHRKSGHIGFLGHGDVLEFRNIRIKEL